MTRPARLSLVLLAVVVGCAGPAPTPPADVDAGLAPIVRVRAGRADTLAAPFGATSFEAHPDVSVRALGDGRVVVEPRAGWSGVALVPFQTAEADGVLAVEATDAAPGLRLRLVGVADDDPSLLEFAVRREGGGAVLLDEEEGVVALVGDRRFEDNAIDAFQDYVFLDLDETGAGRQTVRLAARAGGAVSNWLAVEVEDGRFVREVRAQIVGGAR